MKTPKAVSASHPWPTVKRGTLDKGKGRRHALADEHEAAILEKEDRNTRQNVKRGSDKKKKRKGHEKEHEKRWCRPLKSNGRKRRGAHAHAHATEKNEKSADSTQGEMGRSTTKEKILPNSVYRSLARGE